MTESRRDEGERRFCLKHPTFTRWSVRRGRRQRFGVVPGVVSALPLSTNQQRQRADKTRESAVFASSIQRSRVGQSVADAASDSVLCRVSSALSRSRQNTDRRGA